ncbi:uncharacterized protein LOC124135268 isoform X1 [Haliotis rufescens]|uniref:uncharacterized protein LOC124135268 isoform X1 n=1 Tax=Haliotis rufescens TaxID=6454 RepID=UPI00201E918E|nr:uncharacterized protein LOC124135268 isoform X1 [Haliotis rufescens]
MMASVSVVYEVFSILLLQCISCEADVQNNTVNMTTLECPVDVPAGYEIKGSLEYNTSLYFSCQGCNGQDTWGDSECKPDGTRDEVTLPNCTVSCLNSDKSCTSGMDEQCLFWPVTSWEKCGQSCDTPALCHRESGESDCQCGIYARHGRCEKEADIRDNVCPYTCSLRANITCGDPNILFPHAVASLQTTPHWMDSMSFKCEPGYMNMGPSSWVACSIYGTLTLKYNAHAPHCVPEKIYSMFRYSPKSIRLHITETFPAKSGFECAVACRERSSCIYFIFENNTCDICKLNKWTSGGIEMSGKQLWQKVLPTQYSRDFATP